MNFISLRPMGRALALVACFCCVLASGKPVGSDQAAAAVRGWLKLDRTPVGEGIGGKVAKVESFNDADGNLLYYVVNLEPTGFVIVAGDDRIEPVIAFSKSGMFVREAGKPLSDLVERDMAERAAHVAQGKSAARAGAASTKWQRLARGTGGSIAATVSSPPDVRVAPFVMSHWGQELEANAACYNYFTPKGAAGSANNYPCGCVATAMGQLMRYYRYPTKAVGMGQYDIYIDDIASKGRLRGGNGSGGAYLWDYMPLDPTAPTMTQRQAIGALCHDAGVAAHMQYLPASKGGSGAYLQDASGAFKSPFGYSNSICAFNLQGIDEIGGILNPNMDARMPVVVGIYGASPGGHAVVCDGYGYSVSTLYHHLNMGWSGEEDAWYALPTIETSGGTYTSVSDLIYNVMPGGRGEIISGRVLETTGLPVSNVTVSAQGASGVIRSAVTDTNGIYALAGVDSGSQFAILAQKSGYYPTNGNCFTGESVDGTGASGNAWGVNFTLTRMGAPVFLSQPADLSVAEGAQPAFTALVAGQPPLFYSWYRNGSVIPGATNSTYPLDGTHASNSGDTFYCVASNSEGTATSRVATLTVSPVSIDHFTWAPVASPQTAGNAFGVALTARSASGQIVSNFDGSVSLSATAWTGANLFAEGFESGISAWTDEGGPYNIQTSDSAAVGSKSLSIAGGNGTGSYDGLQHKFAQPIRPDRVSFYIQGTDTNNAGGYVVAGSAKYRTNAVFHFHLHTDGTMGLYDGAVQWHGAPYVAGRWYKITLEVDWTQRTLDYYVDDTLASAQVSFCSTNVSSIAVVNLFNVDGTTAYWDQIEFASATGRTPVSLSPASASGFRDGVWNGLATVVEPSTNVVISVDDGQGHTGVSGSFMVLPVASKPPTITSQPQDQRVRAGGSATFSVGVAGAPPMTFTWTRNGRPIAGASGTNYTVENVSEADSGTHFGCIVENSAGAVTSAAARLLITPTNHAHVAVISTDSTVRTGDVKAKLVSTGLFDAADVDVYCVFSPPQPDLTALRQYAAVLVFSYAKFPDAVAFGNTLADYVDAGGSVVLASAALDSAGGYGVTGRILTGGYLPYTPGVYEPGTTDTWQPDMTLVADIPDHPILNRVTSLNNGNAGWRNHILQAAGATLVARWSTGQPLVLTKEINGNRVAAVNLYPPSSDVASNAWDATTDGGLLMANALRWVSYDGTRMPPYILQQPQAAFAPLSGVITLHVLCSGAEPMTYQWFKGGQALVDRPTASGTAASTLTLSSLGAGDGGSYSVAVSNSFGSVISSSAVVTVMAASTITLQPVDTMVAVGSAVSLSAAVVDNGPVHYQWLKGGSNVVDGGVISGANSPTLRFSAARSSDSGNYNIAVSNLFGSAVSQPAVLTVVSKAVIVGQPVSRTNGLGSTAQFRVIAQGGGLSYQWQHGTNLMTEGAGISGTHSDTLVLAAVSDADSGEYSVSVSNMAGSGQSRVATLTVKLPPSLVNQPVDQAVAFGSNASFQATATGTQPLTYRWFKNGVALNDIAGKITGSKSSNLVIRAVGGADPGNYYVRVSNVVGTAVCSVVTLRVGPTVAVTSPAAKAVITSNAVTVTGSALDAGGPGLGKVLWQLNGQELQFADGLSSWKAKLVLVPGTNSFAVKSLDNDGLESVLVTRSLVYNPYAALAGSYNGLFAEADASRPGHSGLIIVTLGSAGSFSGKLYAGAVVAPFTGKFNYGGTARTTVSSGVQIDLSMDVNGSGALTGQVTGGDWAASVSAVRKGISGTKGTYTLAFEDPDLAGLGLPGDGFATATVSASGSVVLSGRLADDTALSGISVGIGTNGDWPLYSSIYGGKGMVLGWLNAQAGDVGGSVTWAKPAGSNAMSGFTNNVRAAGSSLPTATRLLSWTNGVAIWGGGSLSASITNDVIWTSRNTITVSAGQSNGLALTVNAANGQITGSFAHPVTRQKVPVKAIILNREDEARGYFVLPQPGWFLLKAKP